MADEMAGRQQQKPPRMGAIGGVIDKIGAMSDEERKMLLGMIGPKNKAAFGNPIKKLGPLELRALSGGSRGGGGINPFAALSPDINPSAGFLAGRPKKRTDLSPQAQKHLAEMLSGVMGKIPGMESMGARIRERMLGSTAGRVSDAERMEMIRALQGAGRRPVPPVPSPFGPQ